MSMRASIRTILAGLACVVVLVSSGCSWFRSMRADAPTQAPAAGAEGDVSSLLATEAASPQSRAAAAASTTVSDFYEMRQRLGRSGLPDEGEMKAYRAFLCAPLSASMDAARVRQRLYIDDNPDDKPPLAEGDLFSSLFEGADVVTPADTEISGETARVSMSMRFGEGDKAVRWKDDVLLARDQGSWCIADVEYRGDWPFANKGKLSAKLAEPF
jgi:hypothetical protein